ncbi:hypothetical protein B0J17DRAFT_574499, partial [Rhizoctonia solani]
SPPASASTGTKRKSTASTSASKRVKMAHDPFTGTKSVIQTILASPESFSLPSGDSEYRKLVVSIAQYAKSLEGSVVVAGSTAKPAPPPKTPEQVLAEAQLITSQINRGISKLMAWKPNCKYGRARYAFDGVCPDPRVFGTVFGLDGPPSWKAKKYTYTEFESFVGEVEGRARYSHLVLTSDVNVRYNSETGEFKVSGSYGDAQSRSSLRVTAHTPMNIGGGSTDGYDSE